MNQQNHKSKTVSWEVISINLKNVSSCMKIDQIALKGLWNKQQWEKELSDSQRLCIGIIDNSNLIAFGCSWMIVDELHLTAIAVHPLHRRIGLGQVVLSNLFHQAANKGCAMATLEVESDNTAALALYKSCGFKTAGRRSNYYKNGSDALIQWRALTLKHE